MESIIVQEIQEVITPIYGTRGMKRTRYTEYLEGMTLDYSISLSDSGFKIINPNAARACGCGTSFEPKKKGNEEHLEEGEECESSLA